MSVYVVRTHVLDASVCALFAQLRRDLGEADVYMLYDDTLVPWDPAVLGVAAVRLQACREVALGARALLLNDVELHGMNPMQGAALHTPPGCGPPDGQTPSTSFWRPETCIALMHGWLRDVQRLRFRYVWVIEYDVFCHGSFREALRGCDAIEGDLMAKGAAESVALRCGALDRERRWPWWDNLVGEMAATPMDRQHGVFFPMVRLSHAMVDAVRANFGRSTGFCEVYLPTLCVESGLVLTAMPAEAFGVFRHRPVMSVEDVEGSGAPDDRLYHPVKVAGENHRNE